MPRADQAAVQALHGSRRGGRFHDRDQSRLAAGERQPQELDAGLVEDAQGLAEARRGRCRRI
ncbi:MAG TPA: hypothetical protein VGG06_07610 [Thermoanaerobaculia bacterium]